MQEIKVESVYNDTSHKIWSEFNENQSALNEKTNSGTNET
jgi:hypothetical protein